MGVLATLVAATTFISPASSQAMAETQPAKRAHLRYVALGDSYSAASGVLPLDPSAAPNCLRSTRNYPHVIAARIGARLTDVTCGGADTTHYRGASTATSRRSCVR